MKQYNDRILDLWNDYAALILLVAGAVGFLALLGVLIWARVTKRELRSSALTVSMNLALMLNAEGMWVIAQEKLRLPAMFAVLVFAVFEICFLTATSLAKQQYLRTTIRDAAGKIITPGHPGPMLYIAGLIAVVSGWIVASNALTGTEKLLRLAVPTVIFLMWWAALVAEGQTVKRSKFAYSPRRLAERWGWLIPDADPDLQAMARARTIRRMVINHYRLEAKRWPTWWWKARLFADARTADDTIVEEVRSQLDRTRTILRLLMPAELNHPALTGQTTGQVPATLSDTGEQPNLPAAEQTDLSAADSFAPGPDRTGQTAELNSRAGADSPEPVRPLSAATATAGVPAQRGQVPSDDEPAATGAAGPVPPATSTTVGPDSPLWRPAVARLRDALADTVTARDMHSLSGRGARQLAAAVAPAAPELSEETVLAFIHESYREDEDGVAPVGGLPWQDLLLRPPSAVGSPQWRAAVERLRDALADTLTSDDLRGQSGRGVMALTADLAGLVPELDHAGVRAFVGDYVLARAGQAPVADEPWADLLPPPFTDEDPLTDPDRPRSDAELIAEFGENLARERRAKGKLTRYRVEQVTKAKARQADRIMKIIEERTDADLSASAR